MAPPVEIAATVRDHDPATRCGTVLLDDGRLLSYDSAAFDSGPLLLLRLGQRVRIRVEGDLDGDTARAVAVTLATLDW